MEITLFFHRPGPISSGIPKSLPYGCIYPGNRGSAAGKSGWRIALEGLSGFNFRGNVRGWELLTSSDEIIPSDTGKVTIATSSS